MLFLLFCASGFCSTQGNPVPPPVTTPGNDAARGNAVTQVHSVISPAATPPRANFGMRDFEAMRQLPVQELIRLCASYAQIVKAAIRKGIDRNPELDF